jgi:hypothetical protein
VVNYRNGSQWQQPQLQTTVRRILIVFNRFKYQSKQSVPSATSVRPGEFDLGSIQSRVAARLLAKKKAQSEMRIVIRCIGQPRPDWAKPQPKERWADGNQIETFYCDCDDSDYEERRQRIMTLSEKQMCGRLAGSLKDLFGKAICRQPPGGDSIPSEYFPVRRLHVPMLGRSLLAERESTSEIPRLNYLSA